MHLLARLNHENYTSHTPEVDDEGSATEEDSIDDNHTVELSLRHPNKFSESLAIEVSLQRSTPTCSDLCVWEGLGYQAGESDMV
jgi:hypothetical protein